MKEIPAWSTLNSSENLGAVTASLQARIRYIGENYKRTNNPMSTIAELQKFVLDPADNFLATRERYETVEKSDLEVFALTLCQAHNDVARLYCESGNLEDAYQASAKELGLAIKFNLDDVYLKAEGNRSMIIVQQALSEENLDEREKILKKQIVEMKNKTSTSVVKRMNMYNAPIIEKVSYISALKGEVTRDGRHE